MNLTKKEYAMLLYTITVAVQHSHIADKDVPDMTKLEMFPEAEALVNEILEEEGPVTFQDIDVLFTKLVKALGMVDLDVEDIDLANLPPSNPYVH